MLGLKTKRIFRQTGIALISFLLAAAYLALAVVVIMFLFSSLHLLNPEFFKFKKLDFFTGAITLIIFIISVRVFLKSFKKIYSYLESINSKDAPF